MTTIVRDYAAEYLAACTDDRTPGRTLHQRYSAQGRMEMIAEAAEAAGTPIWDRVYDLDEQARLALYPA